MQKTRGVLWILSSLLACALADAQVGGPQSGPQLPRAQTLPPSGRTQGATVEPMPSPPRAGPGSANSSTPTLQIQGAYQGSVPSGTANGQPLSLTLSDAIQRGLRYNLGTIGADNVSREARAQRLAALAQMLPDVTGAVRESAQQENLAAEGLRIQLPVPGFRFPSIVTFNNFDARASLSESLSLTALGNWRAGRHLAGAADLMLQDSRELVVLAVSGSYLQLIATAARMATASAQIETAKTVYQQAVDRNHSGLAAHIDVNRTLVELQIQQERLTALANEYEKEKLRLARVIGLPMAQAFTLADAIPNLPISLPDLDSAVKQAIARRADVRAAAAQVKAAEAAHQAAVSEYLPSLAVSANYGVLGVTPTNDAHGTYAVAGSVQFPILRSGRIEADVAQAKTALNQRKAEYEDAKGRAEEDVRIALLDLNTAAQQLKVTESNRALAAETLQQARDRFRAGVADTIELVQAQESVASAEQDYITALFSLNVAQISLARATGDAEQGVLRLLLRK